MTGVDDVGCASDQPLAEEIRTMKQLLFVGLLALAAVPSSPFGQAQESFNLTLVFQSVSGFAAPEFMF